MPAHSSPEGDEILRALSKMDDRERESMAALASAVVVHSRACREMRLTDREEAWKEIQEQIRYLRGHAKKNAADKDGASWTR